jgi:hypothetical protein
MREMRDHIEAAERNESFGATGVAARPAAWSMTATANPIALDGCCRGKDRNNRWFV